MPLPLDLDIFSPFSSKNNSYANQFGRVFPNTLQILIEIITVSDKKLTSH